ncbi:MAG TPA: NADH-quinone oxidoreductase subunit L [Dongiaceae bacterium]|nr:NADH-quinone oxidoreductase subunit L [Dongiaceae bacterium]
MEIAVVFLPLLGALVAGLGNRRLGDRGAQLVTCGLMLLSAAFAWILFFQVLGNNEPYTIPLFAWFASGELTADWALRIDTLSAVMLIVVTSVSAMVHVYSVGYMHHDHSVPRFMAYLSLFTFCMLMLVTAANFLQLFFGWEGVGLCSYLLIGFWFDRPSANAAAIKAFVVNRIGDFGFALGIFGVFAVFGSVDFTHVFQAAPAMAGRSFHFLWFEGDTLTILCLLLFVGAMGKSAQIGLHTWLPDAMEGPTPVSALIHAATMVTAGVFMVCRLSPMFEYAPLAKHVVTVVGASTAFFAATVGLTQTDIKRVIAYSTCSQLGYMFFAAGVGAYNAAMFHLFTHAFFKALLFLGAGSVIHAMSGEQDMRRMGGLWRLVPWTYGFMWVGSLALGGIWPFAGFFSKDRILEAAFTAHNPSATYAFWLGLIGAAMTAFYSWRLLLMTFHGKNRSPEVVYAHVHESPPVMLVPLAILALGALCTGFLFNHLFVGADQASFWGKALLARGGGEEETPLWVALIPLGAGLGGILFAYVTYVFRRGLAERLATRFKYLYAFFLNKWYFDELYAALFVRPSMFLGFQLWKKGDEAVIDHFGPDGIAVTAVDLAQRARRLQSGYVYHYAFAMLLGLVALLTWYMIRVRSAS